MLNLVIKLEWDFGDGTEIVSKTGKDTTANHKYTKEGVYEIKVKLYNNDNSTLIGEVKAKAMKRWFKQGNFQMYYRKSAR